MPNPCIDMRVCYLSLVAPVQHVFRRLCRCSWRKSAPRRCAGLQPMKTPDPRHWFAPRCAQRPAGKTSNRLLDSWRIIARAVGGTIMLRKGFSIRDSQTKSRLSFKVPDVGPHRTLKRSLFRDPTAIPMLKQIAECLRVKGYEVTEPKPGKACHGACRVIFPDVEISVVLAVRRRQGKIEFEIL